MSSHKLSPVASVAGVAFLILALLSLPLAIDLPIDNRLERWVRPSEDQRTLYDEFQKIFGSD